MSRLTNALAKYRKALANRERIATEQIYRSYSKSYIGIRRSLDEVIEDIEELDSQGKRVTNTLLYQRTRFRSLLGQIDTQLNRFANDIDPVIRKEKENAIKLAIRSSEEMVIASFGKVPPRFDVAGAFSSFSPRAVEELMARLSPDAPTRALLDRLAPETAIAVTERMTENLIAGRNPLAIKNEIAAELSIPVTRARTILRTEQITAYRNGNLETYKINPDIVKRWRWTAALNDRTCAMCLAMDGREFALEIPFGSHPNCRCAPVPVTKTLEEMGIKGVKENKAVLPKGKDWFNKQSKETKLRILGPTKLRLYEEGRISLDDLIAYRNDKTWGPNRWERSLISIQAGTHKPPKSQQGIFPEDIRPKKVAEPEPVKELRGADVLKQIQNHAKDLDELEKIVSIERATAQKLINSGDIDGFRKHMTATAPPLNQKREMIQNRVRQLLFDESPQNNLNYRFSSRMSRHADQTAEYQPAFEDFKKLVRTDVFKDEVMVAKLEEGPLTDDKDRSYFYEGRLFMGDSSKGKVAVHEMTHAWENLDPKAHKAAVAFLQKRTAGEKPVFLQDLLPNDGYGSEEIVKVDKFENPYTGRLYTWATYDRFKSKERQQLSTNNALAEDITPHIRPGSTEILSMGVERMYDDPIGFAKQDPEYFEFVYNVMKGLY